MDIAIQLTTVGQSSPLQKTTQDFGQLGQLSNSAPPEVSQPEVVAGGGEARSVNLATDRAATAQELGARLEPMDTRVHEVPADLKVRSPEEIVSSIHEAGRTLGDLKQLARRTPDQPAWREVLMNQFDKFELAHSKLDGYVSQLQGGAQFELPELLGIQIQAHRFAQNIEVLSKAVELTTGAFKNLTQQTQV